MPQDRESGAKAAAYGRAMGQILAHLMHAKKVRQGSNEVEWQEHRAVIKSCRLGNTSFGITTKMLDRISVVLVAIENNSRGYTVYRLLLDGFRDQMRDSGSGKANGSVKLLPRRFAEHHGTKIADYTCQDIDTVARALKLQLR